jgi:hypothetical protein
MDRGWTLSRSRVVPVAVTVALSVLPVGARGGSLDTLAAEAAARLGPLPGPGVVVAAPVASDEPGRSDHLAVHLAALVARQLGAGMTASRDTSELEGMPIGARATIFLRTSIVRGDVRMTAELYSAATNIWDRVRKPVTTPTRKADATAKIDAQARVFLTPLNLEAAEVRRFRLDEDDVLAAACAEPDGGAGDELLLVSRRRVALGRLRDGVLSVERSAAWNDLLPRASIPMREPLGGAVAGAGMILVGSTDYGGVAVSSDLSNPERLAGIPVWGGRRPACLVPQPSAGAFDGAPIDCAPSRDPKPALIVPAPRFDAFAATDVIDPKGQARTLVTVREPSGRIQLKWGDEDGAVQGPFGAQIAAADLDQDGFPEVVTSTGGIVIDAIDVASIVAAGSPPRPRLHLPTPAPVRALAICPPGEFGSPAVAAVVGKEVWLVRAELAGPAKGRPK